MKRQRVIASPPIRAMVVASPPAQLTVGLVYTPDDPYAVQLYIDPGGPLVIWTFARELLELGMAESAGSGDVVVSPGPDDSTVLVRLTGNETSCVLKVPRSPLRKFLRASYQAVPIGRECDYLDMDRLVAQLLSA